MHKALAEKILEGCRQRSRDGATITVACASQSPEGYEDCIVTLGQQRDAIAEAARKIIPHLSRNLGSEADIRKLEALIQK